MKGARLLRPCINPMCGEGFVAVRRVNKACSPKCRQVVDTAKNKDKARARYFANKDRYISRVVAWQKLNKDRYRQVAAVWRAKNGDRLRKAKQVWYLSHQKETKSRALLWQKINKDRYRQRYQSWFDEHPAQWGKQADRQRAWRRMNAAKVRAYARKAYVKRKSQRERLRRYNSDPVYRAQVDAANAARLTAEEKARLELEAEKKQAKADRKAERQRLKKLQEAQQLLDEGKLSPEVGDAFADLDLFEGQKPKEDK